MIELKVGDRIKPIGFIQCTRKKLPNISFYEKFIFIDEYMNFICRATEVFGNHIHFERQGDEFNHYDLSAHRKQCRLLVKMVKCDECKGSGKTYTSDTIYAMADNGEIFIDEPICQKCNGKGKVRA